MILRGITAPTWLAWRSKGLIQRNCFGALLEQMFENSIFGGGARPSTRSVFDHAPPYATATWLVATFRLRPSATNGFASPRAVRPSPSFRVAAHHRSVLGECPGGPKRPRIGGFGVNRCRCQNDATLYPSANQSGSDRKLCQDQCQVALSASTISA